MAGILDFLSGMSPSFTNDPAASNMPNPALWGALNQTSPLQGLDEEQRRKMAEAAALGGMGIDPNNTGTPQISPFTVAPQPAPALAPANGGFGAGATPFGFAGPGSNVVNPSQIVSPSPIGPPAPPAAAPQVAAAPASDLSSVNRPPAVEQAVPLAVGNYQMPRIGAADDFEPDDSAPAKAAPPAQAAPGAAPFSLAGNLSAAQKSFQGTNGLIPAIANSIQGGITGQPVLGRPNAEQKQAQAITSTGQALLAAKANPVAVQAAVAQAAAGNTVMLSDLFKQYYGPDKFQHVSRKDGDGAETPGSYDPTTGKYTWANPAPGADSGSNFVTGPDGKQIPIPAGLTGAAKKEFLNKVAAANADAATGKQTEAQAKSAKFSTIATQADSVIKQLEAQGQSVWGPLTDKLPLGGAYAQSPEYQKYKAAKEAFLGAHLRDVSGAAIGSNEYVRAEKTFFPQPGEGPEAVAQKAALRAQLLQEMGRSAGPGYKSPGPSGTVSVGGSAINWSVK